MSTPDTKDLPTDAIDLIAAFATDTKSEEEGKETPIPGLGPTKWKLARINNPSYNRVLDQLYKRNRLKLDSKTPEANAVSERIMAEVFAKTVLVGWVGKVNIGGELCEYSYANAYKLCIVKDLRDKFAAVAGDFNTFLAAEKDVQDEEVKN
jgi:hypothetical protein